MRAAFALGFLALASAGCSFDPSGLAAEPSSEAGADARGDDTQSDDAGEDVSAPDTFAADTFAPDTFAPDTFVPDTFVADTFVADTFVADTFVPDTFVADTFVADTFVADTFVADTFVADTFVPDPPAVSCAALHGRSPSSPSGVYPLDADGSGPGAPADAYCDMVTDGGGWTLVLAYHRAAGAPTALAPGVRPLSPTKGLSHLSGAQMQALATFDTARFACSTSLHARKIHFKTSVPAVVSYLRGNSTATNSDAIWKTGFTALSGHTAALPASTDSTPGTPFSTAPDTRMTQFTFFDYGAAHWAIAGFGTRFECDDWAGSGAYETHHDVWVR